MDRLLQTYIPQSDVADFQAAFTDILHFPALAVSTTADPLTSARTARSVLEELSGVSERPMIIPMTTTGRLQQRFGNSSNARGT